MQTLLTLIQSPKVEVLGITVVSGNQWRDEEVAHTLRLLELMAAPIFRWCPAQSFPWFIAVRRLCYGRRCLERSHSPAPGTIVGGTNTM